MHSTTEFRVPEARNDRTAKRKKKNLPLKPKFSLSDKTSGQIIGSKHHYWNW